MAFTNAELDWLIDDIRHRGVITGQVYCGDCGYNLRSLPYVYRCRECGNEYNARPLSMRGIFLPSKHSLPFRDLGATVVGAGSAVTLGYMALKGRNTITSEGLILLCGLAVVLALFAVHFGWESMRTLFQYGRRRAIARRIAKNEDESAAHHTD